MTYRFPLALAFVAVCAVAPLSAAAVNVSAADAIRTAVVARMGDVEVTVTSLDVTGNARVFREARLDSGARLGKAIRVTLVTADGIALPAIATLLVVGDYVVTTRAVARGDRFSGGDLGSVRAELPEMPIRKLPGMSELIGARALRAVPAGTPVLTGLAAIRRTVEPGDRVTVVVASAAVEVSATFVAADGGQPGSVIRVVNPDTKRYLRGRITKDGLVEVLDGN